MREKLFAALALTGGCALFYLFLHFKNSNTKKNNNIKSNLKANKSDSKTFSLKKKLSEKEAILDSSVEEVNLEVNSCVTNKENIYETVFSEESLTSMQMNILENKSLIEQVFFLQESDNLLTGKCNEEDSTAQEKESLPACSLMSNAVLESIATTGNELLLQSHASSSDTFSCVDNSFEVCNSDSSDNQNNFNVATLSCVNSQNIGEINPILLNNVDSDSGHDKLTESTNLNQLQNGSFDNAYPTGDDQVKENVVRDELAKDAIEDMTDLIKEINIGKSDISSGCENKTFEHASDDTFREEKEDQEREAITNVSSLSSKSNENNSSARSKRQRRKGKHNNVCKVTSMIKTESYASNNPDSEVYVKLESCPIKEVSNISDSKVEESCLPLSSKNQEIPCTSDLEREATPEQEIGTSDSHSLVSQGSCDSGQGSIEVEPETIFGCSMLRPNTSEQYIFYQFEIPQHLVGRLIGKRGAFINKVKAATSTSVVVVDHSNSALKICSIEGQKRNVSQALEMVRHHFPQDQFSDLTLAQINSPTTTPQHQPRMNRQIQQVELPPGVVAEVQASAIVSTVEVWLQQPLHPTFSALQRLHQCLNLNYGDGTSTPAVPLPIQPNTVCVCKIGSHWLRCQIQSHDHEMCTATLLDIGGIVTFPLCLLRQIRVDYVGLPFQAAQSFLQGIQPANDNGWGEEGRLALSELIKDRIIFATIAAYTQEGIPLVNLYQRNHNQYVYVNEKLVELGHAKWIAAIPEMASAAVDPQSEMAPQGQESDLLS